MGFFVNFHTRPELTGYIRFQLFLGHSTKFSVCTLTGLFLVGACYIHTLSIY